MVDSYPQISQISQIFFITPSALSPVKKESFLWA